MRPTPLLILFPVLTAPTFAQWGEELLTPFSMPPHPDNNLIEYQVKTGDMDGDGHVDLFIHHPYRGSFRWLKNEPNGLWPQTYIGNSIFDASSTFVYDWELSDVDSDGDLDIIAGGTPSNIATLWFENQSAGTQWVPHSIALPTGGTAVDLQVADLDGDGDRDLLMTVRGGSTNDEVLLFEASPQGLTFSQVLLSEPTASSVHVLVTDIDGDGQVDVALQNTDLATAEWHRNLSTPGQFQFQPAALPISSKATLGLDWNGDGLQDLVESDSRTIHILPATAPNVYGPPIPIITTAQANGSIPRVSRVEAADMDQDGDPDLVFRWAPELQQSWQAVVENLSDGGPGLRTDFSPAGWSLVYNSWSLVDWEGDGDLDVIETQLFQDLVLQRNLQTFGQNSACPANANSTGQIGQLAVTGSETAEQNATVVTASQVVPGKLTLFLIGDTDSSGVMPPGSQGLFCLGGLIGRFNRPGEYGLADELGVARLQPDLTDVPGPFGSTMVLAGQSRVFQAWYRDDTSSGTPTSNFTDAVIVTFR